MKNIHNVAELAHYIIVFYTQGLGTCLGRTGILVYHLFFGNSEAVASPLNLKSSWQPRYSTASCCLFYCFVSVKDTLTLFKPLVFEKRMDLVLYSPKSIDSLLSVSICLCLLSIAYVCMGSFLASKFYF